MHLIIFILGMLASTLAAACTEVSSGYPWPIDKIVHLTVNDMSRCAGIEEKMPNGARLGGRGSDHEALHFTSTLLRDKGVDITRFNRVIYVESPKAETFEHGAIQLHYLSRWPGALLVFEDKAVATITHIVWGDRCRDQVVNATGRTILRLSAGRECVIEARFFD